MVSKTLYIYYVYYICFYILIHILKYWKKWHLFLYILFFQDDFDVDTEY